LNKKKLHIGLKNLKKWFNLGEVIISRKETKINGVFFENFSIMRGYWSRNEKGFQIQILILAF